MPRELTAAEESAWNRYQSFGTPDEIETQIKRLRKESARYRTRVGELEQAAKDAPAVPEGGRVLTKEEAEGYAVLEALKLKPKDVQAAVEERDKLKGDLARRDRESARDAAAKALGIEGKDLAPFAGADELTYEVREQEVEQNGKKEKVQVAYVKDAEGKELTLSAYGKEKWGRPFEAVLETATNGGGNQPDVTRYTPQTGTTQPRSGKVTEADQRKATMQTVNYAL